MKKESIIRILLWLPVVIWMGLIFIMSAQDGEKSSAVSGSAAEKVAEIVVEDFDTLPQPERMSIIDSLQFTVRKSAHFVEYLILSLLVCAALLPYKLSGVRRTLTATGISLLYAMSDELHQSLSPGRSPKLTDVLIDLSGAVLGVLIFLAAAAIVKKAMSKRKAQVQKHEG